MQPYKKYKTTYVELIQTKYKNYENTSLNNMKLRRLFLTIR